MKAPAKVVETAATARANATPGIVTMLLLLGIDYLDLQATSRGWITGAPGDTEFAVMALSITGAVLVFAVSPHLVSARPTVLAWAGLLLIVAAVQTQAAIAAVRRPALWPVPPTLATVAVVFAAVATLVLLTRRRAS